MKGWLKTNTSDKYLAPVREQVIEMIKPGSDILEFGSGTGDLLFKASSKINYGLGIDASKGLINYSNRKKDTTDIRNIEFEKKLITPDIEINRKFDYGVASLFFHIMPLEDSVNILIRFSKICQTLIIVGFSKPETTKQIFFLFLDQCFNSHFNNFKEYARAGYFDNVIKKSGLETKGVKNTFDPTIKIYELGHG